MNLILAVLVVIAACWVLALMFSLWRTVSRANTSLREELSYLQGGFRNWMKGELKNPPELSDFRVVRGLEWRDGKYVSQSRLSLEAIKSTYTAR